jgi:hypothetical protein
MRKVEGKLGKRLTGADEAKGLSFWSERTSRTRPVGQERCSFFYVIPTPPLWGECEGQALEAACWNSANLP